MYCFCKIYLVRFIILLINIKLRYFFLLGVRVVVLEILIVYIIMYFLMLFCLYSCKYGVNNY